MSYYQEEEDHRSSAKFYGLLFKIAFNIAIIIILYKLLYTPNYPEELRNSSALYIMPIIGTVGTYFYLTYWFGWKNSLYIVGVAGFSIGLMALTSFETLSTLYGLGLLIALGYGAYLLVKMIVQAFVKRR
ncbi:hypothetical protein [Sphingobacterium tabacisoli]|uniref:Uncharacterized protein n=1 Tax=Sphingobacterium tabacisoli TaxID=2044855 RepID=A0ABW5L9A7_9SPHI|nr:hypothetical protein [Sphingobacterium tabacisoli]